MSISQLTPSSQHSPPPPETIERRRHVWLLPTLALIAFLCAAVGLHALLSEFSYTALRSALGELTSAELASSVLATALSYALLTGYDWSALTYVGHRLPYMTVAFASFCGYAISNTVGFSFLTGGSVRYRLYLAAGLEGGEVARVTAFSVLAFALGVTVVAAVSIVWRPEVVAAITHLPSGALRYGAAVLCVGVLGFIVLCMRRQTPVRLFNSELRLPGAKLVLLQLAVSVLDLVCSGGALYALLPTNDIPFIAFLAVYSMATVAGVLSHVPGGLGVFEAILLLAFKSTLPTAELGAALLGYRAIYYLLPFLLAAAMLVAREAKLALRPFAASARGAARLGLTQTPFSMSLLAFFSGLVLLWSVSTPAVPERLAWLRDVVPLALLESSHFIAAAVGGALLVLAQGLRHRLNGAWAMALGLSLLGALSALVKGGDYEEAALLIALSWLLWTGRAQFYRQTALLNTPLSTGWLFGVGGALAGMFALMAFSFKNVAYSHELWWQFEFHGEASRALRAGLAAATAALLLGVWRLLRPPTTLDKPPSAENLARAERIARASHQTYAQLALLGDKQLLFAENDEGFLMFAVHGATWVAMGDPVGPPAVQDELAWRFRELVDRHGGRVAFYQTRAETLAQYVDMGLTAYKLGDEAVVQLETFNLDGGARKALRQVVARATRDGLSFDICPRTEVPARLAELRAISDAWLADKSVREKRFSLGAFTDDYVLRNAVAIVSCHGKAIAFATIMDSDTLEEVSVDLMRHLADAPSGTMVYLFVQLFLHYKAQGYRRFVLGMAPLSGLERHPLAPAWHRFGHLIYERGERFYNFQGLHQFKDKFDPLWEPRYLVCGAGLNPLVVMIDVAALIAGGIAGVFSK